MIQANIKPGQRLVTPHAGHYLLLKWVSEDTKKNTLFNSLLERSSSHFDIDVFMNVLDKAADRCLEEYKELYSSVCSEQESDEYFSWYLQNKDTFTN